MRRYTANGSFDATSFTAGTTEAINIQECDVVTIQLDLFATDTFDVEVSLGNDIWAPVVLEPKSTVGVNVVSTTSSGVFQIDSANYDKMRFNLTGSASPAWSGIWAGVSRS